MNFDSSTISSSYSSPIGSLSYHEFKVRIENRLSGRASSVFLFGSVVTNTSMANDVDIIIVKETSVPFIERAREFFDLYDIACPIDILVYTPSEFQKLLNDDSSSFWRSVKLSLDKVF